MHLSDALLLWLESNMENLEKRSEAENNYNEILKQVRFYLIIDIEALNPLFNQILLRVLSYQVLFLFLHLLNSRTSLGHNMET